jgi:RNA polymerase sigma-70 factor (sigma-E family)
MEPDSATAAPRLASPARAASQPADPDRARADAAAAVTALYSEHALSLIRLAHIMLGDRAAAEDVVHDAFCGLYRRWPHLASTDKALSYLRSSVLNGCRTALRAARRRDVIDERLPAGGSAEAAVLTSERRGELIGALRQLPRRQREVLVLRYYLDIGDEQISRDLRMNLSTIRSTRRRGLAALKRLLKETP